MLNILFAWLTNIARSLLNVWRRLLRRRVDWVRLDIGGELPEFAITPAWWQRRFLGVTAPISLQELRRRLDRIAGDPHTQGAFLKIDGLAAGWATLQSLRDELDRFRASGKRIVAHIITPDLINYYAACAADEIIMPPAAFLAIVGLRAEIQFLKDALAKAGLDAEVEAVSPYKSAYDIFVRSDISPESRAQLERLIDGRFQEIIQTISDRRGKTPDDVRALIDAAPLSGAQALAHGLIDGLGYEDQIEARLQIGERAPTILDWEAARRALRLPMARFSRRRIAVIPIEGAIVMGRSRTLPAPLPLIGGKQAGAATISQALRQAERNRRIAAVVLYINSPGGDAYASDLIAREVLRVRRRKPIVVVMGDIAASGGYYIAAPASAIIAQPGTLTGSIGVVSLRPIAARLFDRVGINTVVLSRGANNGLLSFVSPPTESERQALREQILAIYAAFKQQVCDGRGMTEGQIEPIAGGRVWMGSEARTLGLVDRLGGLPEALLHAQELARLPADRTAPLQVIYGGRGMAPPQPFPPDTSADALRLLEETLRPRIWALLPYDGIGFDY